MGGATLVVFFKRRSWSHQSTWQRFYNKDIIQKGHVFQDMLYKDPGKSYCFKQRTGTLGSTQLSELKLGKFKIRSRRLYNITFSNHIKARSARNVIPIL